MKWVLQHSLPAVAYTLDHHIIGNNHLLNSKFKCLHREEATLRLNDIHSKSLHKKGENCKVTGISHLKKAENRLVHDTVKPGRMIVQVIVQMGVHKAIVVQKEYLGRRGAAT